MNKTNLNTIMAKVKMILNKEGHAKHGSVREFSKAASESPVLKSAGWTKYHAPKATTETTEEVEHKATTHKKTTSKK